MEEPNVNEKERAMGFRTSTIFVQGIFEVARRWILGQIMDLNCLTWIFSLVLAKQLCFGQSHPFIPPHLSIIAPFIGLTMVMQGGVMLQHDKCILGNYGFKDAKGHLWVWNKKLVMSGS
jgi:hypothetical protein